MNKVYNKKSKIQNKMNKALIILELKEKSLF